MNNETHRVVAVTFPLNEDREQHRIEVGKSTKDGLTPTSMVDNGHSVLVTFTANQNTQLSRYSEGDKVQREYTKGSLQHVEKVSRDEEGEEE